MFCRKLFFRALFPLITLTVGQGLPAKECPLLGPALPADFDLSGLKAIANAKESFEQQIEALLASDGFLPNETSIAVDVFSAHTNESIYSYYHTGSVHEDALTAGVFDEHTQTRTGSVSKLFTVYAILVEAGLEVFQHPITQYIPELAGNAGGDPLDKIIWEDITVGGLASHMGGVGGPALIAAGCTLTNNCSVPAFLSYMRDARHPVTAPFQLPIYSDTGFFILGRVLEKLTGLPYNDALTEVLANPLELQDSSTYEPTGPNANGLALPGNISFSAWGYDNQITAPSGGVYSSISDMRKLGLSILHSQLMSQAATRSWMKPLAGTSSLTFNVGAPWEIYRLTLPISPESNRTRVSDLYTKSGGNSGYGTIFALSPDHGIGWSLIVAGPEALSQRWPLRDLISEAFIPAAEHAAVENADENYTGTFVAASGDGSNITLSVGASDGHAGLGIDSWYVDGLDAKAIITGGESTPAKDRGLRLYHTGISSPSDASLFTAFESKGTKQLSFRAVPESTQIGPRAAAEGGEGLFDYSCVTWFNVGFTGDSDGFILEVVDGKLDRVKEMSTGIWMGRID